LAIESQKTKKSHLPAGLKLFVAFGNSLFYGMNGLYGAHVGTGAAVGADIGIDYVNISFGNRFNRAFIYAGAACSTIIVNNVSHNSTVLYYNDTNV
jgi:hypothetical protein